jgi:ABC-type iron transport system FetAB ATPase subunit
MSTEKANLDILEKNQARDEADKTKLEEILQKTEKKPVIVWIAHSK